MPWAIGESGGLRPLLGAVEREGASRFLLAQGWAGLHLGDSLLRWEAGAVGRRPPLVRVVGPAGEIRALALVSGRRLQLLAPLREELEAVREYLAHHLGDLDSVSGLDGQVPGDALSGFESALREVTVASSLRPPERRLPPTRRARLRDASRVHLVYQHVSWMRLDNPGEWSERMRLEPTWVAEEDGRLLAVARWTKRYGRVVEIGGVATDPEHRRRGAATAAVLAATSAALREELVPVLCFMQPELAPLYLGLGYERVGREVVFQRTSPTAAGI